MFKVDVKIDEAGIKRKMIEAAEKQLEEKVRSKGIFGVRIKAKQGFGDKIDFELSGPEEEVKKAREVLSN